MIFSDILLLFKFLKNLFIKKGEEEKITNEVIQKYT